MNNSHKIILITGGAGFIGSNLCCFLLSKNFRVVCLDNFDDYYSKKTKEQNIEPFIKNPLFNLITGDIRDSKLLNTIFENNEIDAVIHLAAKAGVRNSILHPSDYFDVNVNGSLTLLEAMKNHSVKKLVFASSSSVYGNKDGKLNENEPCNEQISPYAISKKATELLNYSYHINHNINVINLRLFSVYGKNQRPDLVIYKFFDLISKDQPIEIYGKGETKRDYTYVGDVVDALYNSILLLDSKSNVYEIVNIGNNNPVSLLQLLALIKIAVPQKNIQVVFKEAIKGDAHTTNADIKKAKNLLNFTPSVTLEKGVNLFYDWFKSERKW